MSDYTQVTDYSTKDALASGDAAKKILGSEIDAEFGAIATAIASKANTAAPALTGAATLGGNPLTAFPSGTAMVFAQTAAPTGWTKSTTHNDKALRVVSGTASSGGATAFTSVFGASKSTGSYTLTTTDIPAHSHSVTDSGHSHQERAHVDATSILNGDAPTSMVMGNAVSGASPTYGITYVAGGNASSTSPITTASSTTGITLANAGGGGGHSHTLSLDLQYVDVIVATKD